MRGCFRGYRRVVGVACSACVLLVASGWLCTGAVVGIDRWRIAGVQRCHALELSCVQFKGPICSFAISLDKELQLTS